MKLLIVTQKVDIRDPILGFFHRWLEEFAAQCESVVVIAQSVGKHSLPSNVTVHSLGKEHGYSRWVQIVRFWQFLWSNRRLYEVVFVHMVPVWVTLGLFSWVPNRKKIYLWYEAQGGGWPLRVAAKYAKKIFGASALGLPFHSAKRVVTGHGIDTAVFCPAETPRDPKLVVTIGRTTKAKNFDLVVKAFAKLPSDYKLIIGGGPITQEDKDTLVTLENLVFDMGLADRVTRRILSRSEVVSTLQQASLFLHASDTALDKVVLEAMACGCPVVSCARAVKDVVPEQCIATQANLDEVALSVVGLAPEQHHALEQGMRERIEMQHSLPRLVERLVKEMT